MIAPVTLAAHRCPGCGSDVAPALRACPVCRTLVFREALEALAGSAGEAEARGDHAAAMAAWRRALELLPEGARQRDVIEGRLTTLGEAARQARTVAGAPAMAAPRPLHLRAWGGLAAVALFFLGKGKLLLLGFTKLKTVLSMFAFFGVYWSLHGWQWALGFVLCIYVHEMGHVAALARYGVRATAPMFIPGLGAFITMQQHLADARQVARVGLAGPAWGLGAGLVAYALAAWLQSPVLGAIAATAGFLNLFNLIPVWQLDGAHAFRAMSRPERIAAALALLALWRVTGTGMVGLVGAVAAVMAFVGTPPKARDLGATATFVTLSAVLAWLAGTHALAAR